MLNTVAAQTENAMKQDTERRTFTVQTTINKPVEEVYDAIVDPSKLEQYFAGKSSGALEPGARVVWHWENWGNYPVTIDEVAAHERIVLRINTTEWKKSESDSYDVVVVFEFESLAPGKTMLKISETGWKADADGIKASYENCGGWQHMATCLKGWAEHGIDLR